MVHNTTSMMRLVNQGMREWGIALHGVGRTIDEAKEDIERGYQFPQILYMSCGQRMLFVSAEKLPNQNIPCPCGNPNHWIVKYELVKEPLLRRLMNLGLRLFSKGGQDGHYTY
jgi:hypothetical protein